MKTFVADLIPRLQRFSKALDDVVLLTDQRWVVFDDETSEKVVYIFRPSNQLLISRDGAVSKGNWELIGRDHLLVDVKEKSYLFKHGFLDERIFALQVDGKREYAILINESKCAADFNTIEDVQAFLADLYLNHFVKDPRITGSLNEGDRKIKRPQLTRVVTPQGYIYIEGDLGLMNGRKIYADQDRRPINDGKYKLGFMWYVVVKNGIVVKSTLL